MDIYIYICECVCVCLFANVCRRKLQIPWTSFSLFYIFAIRSKWNECVCVLECFYFSIFLFFFWYSTRKLQPFAKGGTEGISTLLITHSSSLSLSVCLTFSWHDIYSNVKDIFIWRSSVDMDFDGLWLPDDNNNIYSHKNNNKRNRKGSHFHHITSNNNNKKGKTKNMDVEINLSTVFRICVRVSLNYKIEVQAFLSIKFFQCTVFDCTVIDSFINFFAFENED